VSDPFRDEYAAALARADRLAGENQELREQLAQATGEEMPQPSSTIASSAARAQPPAPAPDLLTRQTLARLETLSQEIDEHSVPGADGEAPGDVSSAASALAGDRPSDSCHARIAMDPPGPVPPAPQVVPDFALRSELDGLRARNLELTLRIAGGARPTRSLTYFVAVFLVGIAFGYLLAR
jgi:hypothetical protein